MLYSEICKITCVINMYTQLQFKNAYYTIKIEYLIHLNGILINNTQ